MLGDFANTGKSARVNVPPVGWVCTAIYQNGYLEILTLADAAFPAAISNLSAKKSVQQLRTGTGWKSQGMLSAVFAPK